MFTRRTLLSSAAALGGASLLPQLAHAKGSMTAGIYPGTWEDAYRAIVIPALKKAYDVDLEFQSLFAVDEVAKLKAARGAPPFDALVLDPGPRITAIEAGVLEKFDGKKLSNAGKVPAPFIDQWGICVGAQVVGIAYNPKKVPAPKGWKDLLADPWVSKLGLTGFQTTFGTVSLIELAKQFGGSETNVDPALVELKKVLPKIAAVGQPAAMPGLFQQGQCDVMYTNTQTVATLKGKGVDIAFAKPESGAVAFYTTLHIAKGTDASDACYKYFDTVISKDVQVALTKAPFNFLPANKEVPIPPDLPMKSLDEMSTYIVHDWTKINPLRAAWIEKFNKEMAK
jgi:putative spermidine/putrescine transport system substrate-binding protein